MIITRSAQIQSNTERRRMQILARKSVKHRMTAEVSKGPAALREACAAEPAYQTAVRTEEPQQIHKSGTRRSAPHKTNHTNTPVNKSQVAKDSAHATQHTERAHRGTGAKWPRTSNTQHNTLSGHTVERERSCHKHRTGNTTHPAGTPVSSSQVTKRGADTAQRACTPVSRTQLAKDTAHAAH